MRLPTYRRLCLSLVHDGDARTIGDLARNLALVTFTIVFVAIGSLGPSRAESTNGDSRSLPLSAPPLMTPAWTAENDIISSAFGYTVASAGDVNGDGFADVVILAPLGTIPDPHVPHYISRGYLYQGSAAGLASVPSWTVQGEEDRSWFRISSAGDVNGDGYDDVIAGAPDVSNQYWLPGEAYLFLGSSTGLANAPAWTAEGVVTGNTGDNLGWIVAAAGDTNDDGYDDVLIGAPLYGANGAGYRGRALLYTGSASGLSITPSWTVTGTENAALGSVLGSAGDINGDGFADVIVGIPAVNSSQGMVSVYLGSRLGLGETPVLSMEGPGPYSYFGRSVGSAGDVNGDGFSDVLIGFLDQSGAEDVGRIDLYLGSAAGLAGTPSWTIADRYLDGGVTAGDFNGDGFADVVLEKRDYHVGASTVGRVELYFGSPSGLSSLPLLAAQSDQNDSWFGSSVANAGDVDHDGYDDLIVGAHRYSNGQPGEGRAFLYLGAQVNHPPVCTGALARPAEIWPANGRLVNVSVAGITDPDGDPVSVTISRITQDEPRDGPGHRQSCPDGQGVGSGVAKLRAEADPHGDGRVYRVTFLAEDTDGAQCAGTVRICVPHDRRRGHACQEGEILIDSTGPCDSEQPSTGFRVDSILDDHDRRPADGLCATDTGACTLRAATEEANALTGPDLIGFDLPAGESTVLLGGALEIKDSSGALTIDGPGAASLAIDGNQLDRIFNVGSGVTASIEGLTLKNGRRSYETPDPGTAGAAILNLGTLTLSGTVVTLNTSDGQIDAGGIANGRDGVLTILDSKITDNVATWNGGGIVNAGTATLVRTTVSGNSAYPSNSWGGGIVNQGSMTLVDSDVSGNTSEVGGGIVNFGTLSLTRSTIRDNHADTTGALANLSGTATLNACSIDGNSSREGDTVDNYETMILVDSTISSNYDPLGATIGSGGTLMLINSTVSGNSGESGAIQSGGQGTLTVLNSTITNNTSSEFDFGGAITVGNGGSLFLRNSLVAGNHAPSDPSEPDSPVFSDCRLEPGATLASSGYNLFGRDTGCSPGATDVTVEPGAVAAFLGPLQANGGSTLTHALLGVPGNPAVNAGDPNGCTDAEGLPLTSDQRGAPRPSPPGGRCDLGSYELQSTGIPSPRGRSKRWPVPETNGN